MLKYIVKYTNNTERVYYVETEEEISWKAQMDGDHVLEIIRVDEENESRN